MSAIWLLYNNYMTHLHNNVDYLSAEVKLKLIAVCKI